MDQPYPTEIDAQAYAELRRDGEAHTLVDVREDWEREVCAIEDSLHLPLMQLPQRLGELPRDRPLVLHCHHGGRSMQATAWLRQQGFDNAINLGGGIDAWSAEVDPAVQRY